MLVKVLHGAVRYRTPHPRIEGATATRSAFRGMTLDIPDKEAQRLLDLGAVVAPEEELPRVGRMRPLPNKASAETLKAWVSVATNDEIEQACEEHPKMADRIRNAREEYEAAMKAQNELQGGTNPGDAPPAPDGQLTNGETDISVSGTSITEPVQAGAGPVPSDEYTDQDLDVIVAGTVDEVSEFLAEYPEQSQRILDAETRRANANNDNVRKGVTEAARVAASHVGQ